MSAAGTKYFPDINGKILLIEEMSGPWSKEERSLRQLDLMGVFDSITGLVVGKVEIPDNEGAPFDLNELLLEVVGSRNYPIIAEFDCSHTIPMHTIGERCCVSIEASGEYDVSFQILESFVE
jgi:muramoyltetrapeptide carboxypeptidase